MYTYPLSLVRQLKWLEEHGGVRLNLHDTAGLTHLEPGLEELLAPFLEHNNPFCRYLKRFTPTRRACVTNKYLAHRRASRGEPYWGRCHLGVWELVVPIMLGKRSLGSLYAGQFYRDEEATQDLLFHKARKYGFAFEEFRDLFFSHLRPLPPEKEELVTPLTFLAQSLALYYQSATLGKWLQKESPQSPHPEDYNRYLKGQRENFLVAVTVAYIKENYACDLSLAELAGNAACSPSYLSRIFKKQTGLSLSSFINQTRIAAAKELLLHTPASISEIAGQTGFADPNYFSRLFRALVGQSPSAFRNKNLLS